VPARARGARATSPTAPPPRAPLRSASVCDGITESRGAQSRALAWLEGELRRLQGGISVAERARPAGGAARSIGSTRDAGHPWCVECVAEFRAACAVYRDGVATVLRSVAALVSSLRAHVTAGGDAEG
jgi:hypothetical protein